MSFEKFDALDLQRDYSTNDTSFKPKGLWYGIRFDWNKYLKKEMGISTRTYLYEIKFKPKSLATISDPPSTNKILQLKTEEDVRTFYKKYVHIADPKKFTYSWSKLKTDFGGIEIPNLNMDGIPKMDLVLGTWDISSGVVWNLSIVASCRRVRREKK